MSKKEERSRTYGTVQFLLCTVFLREEPMIFLTTCQEETSTKLGGLFMKEKVKLIEKKVNFHLKC